MNDSSTPAEVVSRGSQTPMAELASRGTQVHFIPEVASRGTQVQEVALAEAVSRGTQAESELAACPTATTPATETDEEEWEEIIFNLMSVAQKCGVSPDQLPDYIHSCKLHLAVENQASNPPLVHGSTKSWSKHYSALSFLMNGHLHAEYEKLSGMLGLPSCSHTTWHKIIDGLNVHVSALAEMSCSHVRERIKERGDQKEWVASFDGFYLTRGHHSNNSSATLHDHRTGNIAWFCHRTKRGPGHNWEGTSGGAEGHMFEEILGKVKEEGFVVGEVITDKDSSMNTIFCKYFPEGTITYCANHCAKTMHKNLQQIKQYKCEVHLIQTCIYNFMYIPPVHSARQMVSGAKG